MHKKTRCYSCIILLVFIISSKGVFSEKKVMQLVKHEREGGITLMSALNKRSSSRSFSDKQIPDRVLSNMLWAACGINRAESGKRTAPSAMDKQEIEIYAAMKDGLYKYNAAGHTLELVVSKDIRHLTGQQGFVKNAPVNLIYVADMSKVAGGTDEEKLLYAGTDTGFIGENVYLYCASEGLATVIRAYIDKKALGKAMNLKDGRMIILSQTVGYPGK
jgi:SagB-type dehydrogenase family enzyme